jgi:dihydrofolate reductase
MGSVLWHVTMSLDGFIAGPGGQMDWVFEHAAPGAVVEEVIRTTGAILAGRRSYAVGERDAGKPSGAPYGGAWSGPVFVLTHEPPAGEPDPAITFLSGDIGDAVAKALAAAEGRNVVVFGANVARQCLDAGLLDEILIHVSPVLLGDGVRLHGGPGARRVDLQPISTELSGAVTTLRFRVSK